MALLGTYWHKFIGETLTAATGGALTGIAMRGLNHSLGTTPELVLPCPISVTPLLNHGGFHGMLQLGGNPSMATVGAIGGSVASYPTVTFDAHAAILHSVIR